MSTKIIKKILICLLRQDARAKLGITGTTVRLGAWLGLYSLLGLPPMSVTIWYGPFCAYLPVSWTVEKWLVETNAAPNRVLGTVGQIGRDALATPETIRHSQAK